MLRLVLAGLLLAAAPFPATAQSWPARPVRVVLSQPPGSSPDILARLIADRLSKLWDKPVVVENRPGGQNVVGALAVLKAPADGYTFYHATAAALVINAYTFKALPYDPKKDFVPVGMVGQSGFVVAVNPSTGFNSIRELVAYAKANPDKLSVATEGPKTFSGMMASMLAATAGVKLVAVPYSGVQPGILDTVAGRTQLTIQAVAATMAHLQRGALRPLAVTTARRLPGLDQVPTLSETYPGFEYSGWQAVVAQQGTPADALRRFSADLAGVLKDPEMVKRLFDLGIIAEASTAEQLGQYLDAEHARWAKLARDTGVVPE
ncbi:MAG: tripartite tricarboxylate transporter substrate binding protein [Burkholderiales bacterium]|nr:tripartite tricarboxylate transporter substrate binding protein [Burkholderiales bacterium]